MDTKGKELHLISERIKEFGCDTVVMEFSLGKEVKENWINISIAELLAGIGKTPADIFPLTRGEAAEIVTEAGIKKIREMKEKNLVHGMIAYCGGMGSSIAAPVMRALPYGMPKILLSTMIHNVSEYIGAKDLTFMYSVTESGLNTVSRGILNSAAGLVAGGAKAYFDYRSTENKPLVAVTMQGVTTPCSQRVVDHLSKDGKADGMIIHANGEGGKTLEYMIDEGCFAAVADITLGELSANMLHGINDAGKERLSAATSKGIPQLLVPGSVDFSSFKNRDAMAPWLLEEEKAGVVGRKTHFHNTFCTVCTITPEEGYRQGQLIARKISRATRSVCVVVPMRGWSAYDIAEPDIKKGWAGPGHGPSWVSAPDKPEWSLRAIEFIDGFMNAVEKGNKAIELYTVDRHINDPEFADIVYQVLKEIMSEDYVRNNHVSAELVKLL